MSLLLTDQDLGNLQLLLEEVAHKHAVKIYSFINQRIEQQRQAYQAVQMKKAKRKEKKDVHLKHEKPSELNGSAPGPREGSEASGGAV